MKYLIAAGETLALIMALIGVYVFLIMLSVWLS